MEENQRKIVAKKMLDIAIQTRQLEIELFWKRSLFFWGFIAAAFLAYATLHEAEPAFLKQLIAAFGLVCSLAWTLVNRGSKYWQENWETKVNNLEYEVFGEKFFAKKEAVQRYKGWWLSARRYSVSKLAIALSDFTAGIWLLIFLWAAFDQFTYVQRLVEHTPCVELLKFIFPVAVLAFAILMILTGKSGGLIAVQRTPPDHTDENCK